MKRIYVDLNVDVKSLYIKQSNFNTKQMLNLMIVKQNDEFTFLYVHTINRIFKKMKIVQQKFDIFFKFNEFKRQIVCANLMSIHLVSLNQRFDTLKNFLA